VANKCTSSLFVDQVYFSAVFITVVLGLSVPTKKAAATRFIRVLP